jgi:integrase
MKRQEMSPKALDRLFPGLAVGLVETLPEDTPQVEPKKLSRRLRGMGRIFPRPNSPFFWIAYYHRGKEVRESTQTADQRKAEAYLKRRLREVGADQLGARRFVVPKQEKVLVGELLDALEADYRLQGTMSPQVLSHLKPIREALADRRAVAVTAEVVDNFIEDRLKDQEIGGEMVRGKAPATVNRETQLLGQAFRLAVERGRLNFTPKIRHLDETGNVRQGFFERDEFEAVVVKLPAYLQDFARFAYWSGWRKGEIASLTWAGVDGRVIRLKAEDSKNKYGKQVPLVDPFKSILERRWEASQYKAKDGTPALSPYVFHRNGEPVGDFRKGWATACKEAGYPGKLFHDFCRTAIRNLVRAGVSETVVMKIAGRRTRAIFDRYNITDERDLREAFQATETHVGTVQSPLAALPAPKALREATP